MIKKNSLLMLGLALMLSACNSPATDSMKTPETAKEEKLLADNQFGEAIDAEGAISFDKLLAKMQQNDSLAVKVKGQIDAVCQAKGCWMNIASEDPDAENMMVRFKDYGFFVPKDISGREVIMEGYAYRETTPVDELRHLAEDAGKSPEEIAKITEPKVELKFMASGVLLLDKT